MKIAQQVESLEAIETAGELGALLLESHLIKTKLPIYNKMLRTKQELIALRSYTDSDGYLCVSLNPVTQVKPDELDSYIGFFRSRRQARDYLANLAKENSLCEKLLELEKTTTSCFGYRLERCKGACVKKELPLAYNMRFIGAFSKSRIKPWPYKGPILIEEKNELTGKNEYFLVDKWCYLGNIKTDMLGSLNENEMSYDFDLDTYKILIRYLFSNKSQARIRTLSNSKDLGVTYQSV